MHWLIARLRIRALGVAVRLIKSPAPFMLTGPGSSVQCEALLGRLVPAGR